jgi:hypothetical protein
MRENHRSWKKPRTALLEDLETKENYKSLKIPDRIKVTTIVPSNELTKFVNEKLKNMDTVTIERLKQFYVDSFYGLDRYKSELLLGIIRSLMCFYYYLVVN